MADIYDGAWRLFSYEPLTGRSIWIIHDAGAMHFRIDTPVENLVRENAAQRAESQGKKFGEFVRVASVPENIYEASGLAEAHQQRDKKFIARFHNDSDNRAWRVKEGSV